LADSIPILDLKEQTRQLEGEVLEAFRRVMAEAAFIKGPDVRAFEGEFASYIGAAHAIGVANGTDALVLALRALDIGPGDEVITTTFSFIASAECISLIGATPVLVDIDPRTFTMDPARLAEKITPRTRAIIPVHLYGQPAEMEAIQAIAERHRLAVVEDCAQATGATCGGRRVGSFGTFGCFSFFPSKNLGAFGDGGAVTTSDPVLAEKVRWIADHGSRIRYQHELLGTNSRLDSLQAAVLRVKMKHLERWNERRRQIAARYTAALGAAEGVTCPSDAPYGPSRHVYHQYTLRVPGRRDAVREHLAADGITAVTYYPISLHRQPVYASLGHPPGSFPHAEQAQEEVLSLPMFPELSDSAIDRICARVVERLTSPRQETLQAAG
jgi:dTDP-4-amino-4,6-dideoxygalactose transaminase